jgi:hypothetical protein
VFWVRDNRDLSLGRVVVAAALVDDNDVHHDPRVKFLGIIVVYRLVASLSRARPRIQEGAEARTDAAWVDSDELPALHRDLYDDVGVSWE